MYTLRKKQVKRRFVRAARIKQPRRHGRGLRLVLRRRHVRGVVTRRPRPVDPLHAWAPAL